MSQFKSVDTHGAGPPIKPTPANGGPAFPTHDGDPGNDPRLQIMSGGMSLRDWFAGQALANEALGRAYHNRPDILAAKAFEYADAMLAARAVISKVEGRS